MSAAVTAMTGRRTAARGGVRRERHDPAFGLLLAVMALTAIGIVMVYSASSVRSYFNSADPSAQGMEQIVWAAIGLVGLLVASRIDFRHLRYLAIPIFVITLALLVAVLIPGIGSEINGSRRWIVVPGFGSLQPAEFAKLAVVVGMALLVAERTEGRWRRGVRSVEVLGMLFLAGLPAALIMLQPDQADRRPHDLLHPLRRRIGVAEVRAHARGRVNHHDAEGGQRDDGQQETEGRVVPLAAHPAAHGGAAGGDRSRGRAHRSPSRLATAARNALPRSA